jgi:2-polyprenyl-3-methyl-5-hydroxy-6-metoxy-1,4-benzoquinol methylase
VDADADALANLIDCLQDGLRDWLSGGIRRQEGRQESWAFVGARIAKVLAQLHTAKSATGAASPTFLECGSGVGIVASLAKSLGFTVTALEIVPKYIELSRRFFPSVTVEEADLRTFDRFGEYDVVYYYAPFGDLPVQRDFERRIEAGLRPGAIVVCNGKVDQAWRASGLEQLASDDSSWWVLRKKLAAAAT